jgi:hypothetical protein
VTAAFFIFGLALGFAIAVAGAVVDRRVIRREHEREMERTAKMYERILEGSKVTAESLLRLATTGVAEPIVAAVSEREPDMHERASRLVTEQTIARGVEQLREAYRKLGIQVSDDDLAEEAQALLMGVVGGGPSFREPAPAPVRAEAMR